MKNQIAVVVPVPEESAENKSSSVQVWGRASELVKPALGRFCGKFYPADEAWGYKIRDPFGVVFGKKVPEEFLAIYLAALQAQQSAVRFHLENLITAESLDCAGKIGDTLICAVHVDAEDTERATHALWYACMQSGVLFPDCGVYYADHKRAIATQEIVRNILANPAGYALSVVSVEPLEEENGCF